MSAENALADLGLDLGGASEEVQAETPVTDETVTDTPAAEDKVTRERVKVETSVSEDFEELPALERNGFGGGPREKKYPFDELAAPKDLGEGKMGYASFKVVPAEGEDMERTVRSVQSAATQANRQAKEANESAYYETRTITEEGAVVGIKVFRTDARPERAAK